MQENFMRSGWNYGMDAFAVLWSKHMFYFLWHLYISYTSQEKLILEIICYLGRVRCNKQIASNISKPIFKRINKFQVMDLLNICKLHGPFFIDMHVFGIEDMRGEWICLVLMQSECWLNNCFIKLNMKEVERTCIYLVIFFSHC